MTDKEKKLLEALRKMVSECCTGPGGRLFDYGNPINRQALKMLEEAGVVVKADSSREFWEWSS